MKSSPLQEGQKKCLKNRKTGSNRPVFLFGITPAHRTPRKEQTMIYTVTFNPSLDYIVTVDDFAVGKTNRTTSELMLPGGKGINVSTVLCHLGIPNTAVCFSAGFVGEEIVRRMQETGIRAEAIPLPEGNSRINLKLRSIDGTEINGMGPVIPPEKLQELMEKLDQIRPGDMLILAGSIPASMPETIYRDILDRLEGRGIDVVVDAEKDLLVPVLAYRPFLIKPNEHELGAVFGVELPDRESVVPYARELQNRGARHVLVSMASKGAVLVAEDGRVFQSEAPKGTLINAVGAGDSMVAGFIAGWLKKQDPAYAFRLGLCAGSASAFSEYLATEEAVTKLYEATFC